MKQAGENLLNAFARIKKDRNLVYYDTHVHPQDVFGICYDCQSTHKVTKPSLLEYFEYADGILEILALFFMYFPRYIQHEIRKKFPYDSEEILLKEMQSAEIDRATIVPIYPHAAPQKIYTKFTSSQFIRLGSVDIHNLNLADIEKSIESQITEYSIVGIKLHPNIQSFYPEPSLNDGALREKLETIYSTAEKYGLYILIHGGLSYVPVNNRFEKREFGLSKHFFNENGETFIQKLKISVIIAHLGLYNVTHAHFEEIGRLYKCDNSYFDTAGVSPKLIEKFINTFGSEKIVFGSDAPYFNLKYNVYLVLKAIRNAKHVNFEDTVTNIFSKNYQKILRGIKQ